jgi:hypothetical protein
MMTRSARVGGLVGLLSLALAACATIEVRETRTIVGRVTDEAGRPVASSPVNVIGRTLDLVALEFAYQERGRQRVDTTTNAEGNYRLAFVPADLGNNFYLFFYAETGFDGVQYRRPEPLEITELLRSHATLSVNQVLQFHPAWPEVRRQIAFYGDGSERGRILRLHGLPEGRERRPGADGELEVWSYAAAGVRYWFDGDRLTRTERTPPTK